MARINIEDQFWLDIVPVAMAVGDQDKAIGMVVRLIKFAQEKYKQGEKITKKEFLAEGFTNALAPKFVIWDFDSDYVELRGVEKHFSWMDKRRAAGAKGGKRSAQRPRDNKGRLLPKDSQADPSNTQAKSKQTNQTQASISSSISSSNSKTTTSSSDGALAKRSHRYKAKSLDEVIDRLPKKTIEHWREMYPDDNTRQSIVKNCFHYYDQVAPNKKPVTTQGWSKKIGSWLDSDYGKKVQGPRHKSKSQQSSDANRELAEKLKGGLKDGR